MRLFLLASLLLIPAAVRAQSAAPEQLPDAFIAAWNAHDIEAFRKLYAPDATWVPSAEERTEGREAILGEFSKVHQGNGWAVTRKVALAIKGKPKVRMLRPDVAVIFFRMDFLADGKVAPDQHRTLILVAGKSGDGWRISAGQLTK
ncbi:SgcJ/EcaC family oxidoreductase [Sphingopyxis sp.]|uniref:SgcJ/EcaC family oxidoreductase n=1 Tax=Sphingopyxis sp. TaxID=1908224 RepID=UPI002ED81F7F